MPFTREQIKTSQEALDQTENGPWRKIFLDILRRAKQGQSITYAEGEHLYRGLKVSMIDIDRPEDIAGCDDYRFVFTFLTYAPDLNGATEIVDFKGQPISIGKKQNDVKSLEKFADEWEQIVTNHNHQTDALRIIAKEARFELRQLDKEPIFWEYGFLRKCNLYDAKRRRIILHSKFVYCKYLEVFEELKHGENIFRLNGSNIEFTELSFLHIVFGHYAKLIKQTDKPNKSYHNEDFKPNDIISRLRQIFNDIDLSGMYTGQDIKVLNFEYKRIDYKIYVNQRQRSLKRVGSVSFWQIETFFPIEDILMKETIEKKYRKMEINEILSVYVL